MASHTVSGQRWPDGTTVGVYPAAAQPDPGRAPSGIAVTSSVVASGAVTFNGVSEQVPYVAYAASTGVRFLVPAHSVDTLRVRVEQLETATPGDGDGGDEGGGGAGTGLAVDDYLDAASGDVTGAVELAITAATEDRTKAGAVSFTAGSTYQFATRPVRLGRNHVGLDIYLNGATLKCSTGARGIFDLWRVADFDVFCNIRIHGPGTVDANNVGGKYHVLLGNLINGGATAGHQQNIRGIRVDGGIQIINVPRGTDVNVDWRIGVALHSWNNGDAGDPQTTITDVVIDGLEQTGGLAMVNIAGMPFGGGVLTANVWLDEIHVRNWRHDEGELPAQFNAGNHVIIGNKGFGGRCTVENGWGRNCSDCGVEINAMQTLVARNLDIGDAWNHAFYHAPYHALTDPDASLHTWANISGGRSVALGTNLNIALADGGIADGAGQGFHYASKSNGNYPANVLVDGYQWDSAAQHFVLGEAADINGPKRITLKNFQGVSDIGTYTGAASVTASMVRLASYDASQTTTLTVDSVTAKVRGSKAGAGAVTYFAWVLGNVGRLDLNARRVVADFSLNGSVCHCLQIGDNGAFPTVWGTVDGLSAATGGASSATGVRVGRRGNTTIPFGRSLTFNDPDFGALQGSATELDAGSPSNGSQIHLVRPRWRNLKAAADLTVPDTGPFVYLNESGYAERVLTRAGTVTALGVSQNDQTLGTGTTASGSNQITSVAPTVGNFSNGQAIFGDGIPDGTTVTGGGGTATLTLSQNATASAAGVSLRATTFEDLGVVAGEVALPPGGRVRAAYSVKPTQRRVPV